MKMQKGKSVTDEWKEPPKPPTPTIPNDVLMEWLESKIKFSGLSNVSQVKAGYLYEKNGVERYRIDVWASDPIEHMFTMRHYISHSWFVHYDQIMIIDKTLGEAKENKNKIKKLEGIADGNVRVGKSPW